MADKPAADYIIYSPQNGFHNNRNCSFAGFDPDFLERRWRYSGESGAATFIKTEIRPGFDIWVINCYFRQRVICSMHDNPAAFSFGFCLSGNTVSQIGQSSENVTISGGQQGVFYCASSESSSCVDMGVPLRQVGISIEPDRLLYYLKDEKHMLPPVLRDILENNHDENFFRIRQITANMHNALNQILDCPHRGMTRKLFLESRALELIAYQLDNMAAMETSHEKTQIIHPEDRRQTVFAHTLLVKNIENPPHLKELAKAAGMSHPKLNRCFRQVFGATVFECLRNERLLRAREMLEQQGLTVTEAAYAVGYNSISHFSQAYKKHFGRSPCGRPNMP
jgi:AraC-like DNA-binding protein